MEKAMVLHESNMLRIDARTGGQQDWVPSRPPKNKKFTRMESGGELRHAIADSAQELFEEEQERQASRMVFRGDTNMAHSNHFKGTHRAVPPIRLPLPEDDMMEGEVL
jgi:hypothetical protein